MTPIVPARQDWRGSRRMVRHFPYAPQCQLKWLNGSMPFQQTWRKAEDRNLVFWRCDAFEPQPTHLRHFTRRRLHPAAARQKRCIGSKLEKWSERRDSNPRPLVPQTSALPGCATLRLGTGIRSSVFCGQEQNGPTKGKTWKCRSSPQSSTPGNCATFSNGR
jgi:hypothetical protein